MDLAEKAGKIWTASAIRFSGSPHHTDSLAALPCCPMSSRAYDVFWSPLCLHPNLLCFLHPCVHCTAHSEPVQCLILRHLGSGPDFTEPPPGRGHSLLKTVLDLSYERHEGTPSPESGPFCWWPWLQATLFGLIVGLCTKSGTGRIGKEVREVWP